MRNFLMVTLLVLFLGSTGYADLTDGLVLHMPLDEGAGTTVTDLSPNGFTGELQGTPEWVDGQFGMALRFPTSADLVSIADNPAFHIEDAITQAAWVNLDQLPSAHAIIFGTRGGAADRLIGFGFGMNPANNIKIWTNGATGGFLDINVTEPVLEPGIWYHLAYTHTSGNNGLVEVYLDGAVIHSQESGNPVAPAATTSEVTIGTWAGEAWPGIVDEAMLWNRALAADEILDAMDGLTVDPTAVEATGKLAATWGGLKTRVR